MLSAIYRELGVINTKIDRVESQTTLTNGHVADAFVRIDALERVNDTKAGAESERKRITKLGAGVALFFATAFGGAIAVEFAKLVA